MSASQFFAADNIPSFPSSRLGNALVREASLRKPSGHPRRGKSIVQSTHTQPGNPDLNHIEHKDHRGISLCSLCSMWLNNSGPRNIPLNPPSEGGLPDSLSRWEGRGVGKHAPLRVWADTRSPAIWSAQACLRLPSASLLADRAARISRSRARAIASPLDSTRTPPREQAHTAEGGSKLPHSKKRHSRS